LNDKTIFQEQNSVKKSNIYSKGFKTG